MGSAGFLLRKEDYPKGIATQGDVEKLAALINPYLNEVNALTGESGVSLTDNLTCEVQVGTLSHGVASRFSLKRLKQAKGCVVLGCDKAIPIAPIMQPVLISTAGALPQVAVTVWFNDPGVTSAKVALLFLPEGQLTTGAPKLLGDTAWTAVAGGVGFTNGWADLAGGGLTVGFFKDANGTVYLRGTIKSGTIGLSAFTLPAGYRPVGTARIGVASNGAFGEVDLASSGTVTPSVGSTAALALDGITFDTRP